MSYPAYKLSPADDRAALARMLFGFALFGAAIGGSAAGLGV